MEQSISFKISKGSIAHNARDFTASNVDSNRSQYNIEYVNKDLKQTYHELFDDAVTKYNARQTRSDRTIPNYYEKIRMGKQEKVFHEVIVQVGNMDTMNCLGKNGELGKVILDEYMKGFQERNPNLYVFSAHLHMDEQTPHLHIDFIPFTTGSKKRTRNSCFIETSLKISRI
ncbi:MAG: plasmid recombination protein [Holdemanella porci]